MGRAVEAEESFRRAAASVAPAADGLPAPVAARLANQHAELGDAYAEAGALSEAIEQYARALELGPGYHDLRYRMARLMLEAGRPLEARESKTNLNEYMHIDVERVAHPRRRGVPAARCASLADACVAPIERRERRERLQPRARA